MWRGLGKATRCCSYSCLTFVHAARYKSTENVESKINSSEKQQQQQQQHKEEETIKQFKKTSSSTSSRAKILGWILGASLFPILTGSLLWYTGDMDKLLAIYRQHLHKIQQNNDGENDNAVSDMELSPKKKLGGPFTIRESKNGKYITDQELFNNHWTLLYFGFSKCAEVCPSTLSFIAEVLHRCDAEFVNDPELANEAARLQAAFLSIDFIRDTPEVVERFVSKYEPRIRGLCGSRLEVEQAAQVWHVYYSSVDETDEERAIREAAGVAEPEIDDTYQFDHSAAIYLVGPDGKMKDFFFKEMGEEDMVNRLGVHFSDVYGFSDTRALS